MAALVYLIFFSNADLFKIAGSTAIAAIPLVSWVLLKNKSSAQIVAKFEPWLYVSHAMQTLGLANWLSGPLAFAVVALPIYLLGCLGLRVIGVPAILTAVFRPRPGGGVRFLLGIFVVIGVVLLILTLTILLVVRSGWGPTGEGSVLRLLAFSRAFVVLYGFVFVGGLILVIVAFVML